MQKVYVYYESWFKKISTSTTVDFEVFSDYKIAHDFMLSRRDIILEDKTCFLDETATGEKDWLRIHKEDNYLDLIIESRIMK